MFSMTHYRVLAVKILICAAFFFSWIICRHTIIGFWYVIISYWLRHEFESYVLCDVWEGVSCIVNISCFGCWAFNSFWWGILSFNWATPASLSALYLEWSSSSPSGSAAQHITSGYSNQSLLFSSLQLRFQRWTMKHLPGGLHSYTRHLNSLPHVTLILVYSEGYRRENSLPVALDMLSLQETCSGPA